MLNEGQIFKKILALAEENRKTILDAFFYIKENPETGFREVRTSKYMQSAFEKLGYRVVTANNIPGFYTVIDTGIEGPEILVLGEMDALICKEHPESDKITGAVHNCGHNAQCAALLGLAAILKDKDVLSSLCGKIRLCAVPAEEGIETEYREGLQKQGIIEYLNGKTEFLHRGYFDNVDMAFMVHTTEHSDFRVTMGNVGFITKKATYKGRAAHAGARPWNGINALYAATQGISAVNAIRETFKEEDIIRFHPIVTEGGVIPNAIPNKVVIQASVRGTSFEAAFEANRKINRALCGAALSIGANISIDDKIGYAPLKNSVKLIDAMKTALNNTLPERTLKIEDRISAGSTDMGDLSCLMPVIHPYVPGAIGSPHGADYRIENTETACVLSAAWQAATIFELLKDNGAKAREAVLSYDAPFKTKEDYFNFRKSMSYDADRISYNENGTAYIRLN